MAVPLSIGAALRLSAATIAAVNAAGFTVTAITKSHKITDLCGTSAFLASAWATHAASLSSSSSSASSSLPPLPPSASSSSSLARLARILRPTPTAGFALAAVVTVWGARLSSHLFRRVLRLGKDERLDFLFPAQGEPPVGGKSLFPLKLAGFWTAQGVWAFVCLLPVTAVHGTRAAAVGARLGVAGAACVSAALAFVAAEAVADKQKDDHYKDPSKKGKPCIDGLYSVVRFPNYAAEIGFWSSIAAAAAVAANGVVLKSAPLAVAASPAFTYFLLTRASGIPPLQRAHDLKYSASPEYQRWKREVPRLFPDVFKLISKKRNGE